MLVHSFNPFGNLVLSSLIAAIPIILFLLCLTVFKMKGIYAAITTLVVTLLIAIPFFKLPGGIATGGVIEGFYQGIIPIGYIVIMAVLLYKTTQESGQFSTIQDSIMSISQDQRIQLLLIGFAFNGFLEGAAGFGVPIAICALLLAQLGFKPLQAAMLCLIANAASGAFGAIGIPVGIVNTLHLPGHVQAMAVSQTSTLTLAIINFIIPFLLIFIIDGFKGIKETLPQILVASITFTVLQGLITVFVGPELADIIPPLVTMGVLAVFSKKVQPKNIFRIQKDVKPEAVKPHSGKEILYAWSPFIILTVIVMIWSATFFKNLFAPNGPLSALVFNFNLPGTYSDVTHKPIMLTFNFIGQTGTAILLTIIITVLMSKKVSFGDAGRLFVEAFKELWLPILTICFILAISKITTYGGLSAAMGQGIAKAGGVFPILSPILGWIGVFMTGSVVNNNSLFAPIQASVAQQIGTSAPLLVAANTVGGVAAKLISPQSIAIATAAVKQVGKESELLKMTLKYSIGLLIFICIWTFILSIFM
ncbi:L-lactate permease [Staphylococcus hominis]|uniref:L-lactate permease n=1 Tax=Staphylococcus hominis TaxID=1290 RepID=UPI000778D518|nr:L-lactate permease [Staphylococcus hominis]MBK1405241.1 L-lactate permease [Staphylococcus hominis]OAW33106.1 L-lactate permease [Staphylococcus hominis]PJM33401.1 L-lactate permease [Staphylococcus hominis]PJM56299.1 L-lactate permease [Staphylococcus hominis]PNZ83071.1 L-lactate permease [Staphylococcus hominis subsp. novobiosepticus]